MSQKAHRPLDEARNDKIMSGRVSSYFFNIQLTKNKLNDKMKKFSYIDKHGNKQENSEMMKKQKINKNDSGRIGRYINLGYYLVIPILFGLGIGLFLDRKLNTKPWFTMSLLVLGTIFTFYNLFTIDKKDNEGTAH